MAIKQRNGIIETGAIRPESDTTCSINVRVTHRVERRECYQALERREIPTTFIPRFHTKYNRVEGACWLWQAGKYRRGYGMFSLGRYANGQQHVEYAHRVAYVIAKGNIPQGLVVRHSCDVPACINPDHLILGTQGDNVNDAAVQGHYSGPRADRQCRVSAAQVRDIRESSETIYALASRHGISPAYVSLIRRGLRRKVAA